MKVPALFLVYAMCSGTAFACAPVPPNEVAEMVKAIAEEEGLDSSLALAVASVESSMGSHQISDAGAEGIMQLMPSTAADYGVTDRCDARSNIQAGIRYLKKLYSEFDDPLLMLAAYNAGPARVYERGGVPEFTETANYIVKVMNRWKLTAKLEAHQPSHNDEDTTTASVVPEHSPWRDAHVWSAE